MGLPGGPGEGLDEAWQVGTALTEVSAEPCASEPVPALLQGCPSAELSSPAPVAGRAAVPWDGPRLPRVPSV